MTTIPADGNPFHGLVDEASATLRELLAAEGLTDEAPAVLPAFERAVRAAVTTVEASLPADLPLDFALAYLTGRIAEEQVITLQNARILANAARARAEQHWQVAIGAGVVRPSPSSQACRAQAAWAMSPTSSRSTRTVPSSSVR